MTKRLRALNSGRLRVWWVCHREQVRNHAALAAILGLWMLQSHFAYQDDLDLERAAREAVTRQRDDLQKRVEDMGTFSQTFPRVAFVIEARDRAELDLRLAEIAGDLDAARARP